MARTKYEFPTIRQAEVAAFMTEVGDTRRFAKMLGIPRTTLQDIVAGRTRTVSPKIEAAIKREFPKLDRPARTRVREAAQMFQHTPIEGMRMQSRKSIGRPEWYRRHRAAWRNLPRRVRHIEQIEGRRDWWNSPHLSPTPFKR